MTDGAYVNNVLPSDITIFHKHAEAPASWTVRYHDPSGFDCMLTLRDSDTEELLNRTNKALGWLTQVGCTPGKPTAPLPNVPVLVEPEEFRPGEDATQELAYVPVVAEDQYETFTADKIHFEGRNPEGEPKIKLCGGKWSKFGVIVWPETLQLLGINPDALTEEWYSYGKEVKVLMVDGKPKKVVGLA